MGEGGIHHHPRDPREPRHPAYDRTVPGDDGTIWLREYPLPSDTVARWVLVGAGPQLEGRLSLPRSSSVLAGNADWLVVLTRDEMDAPVVEILRRGEASGR